LPPATIRVELAKSAAKIGSVDGVMMLNVSAPSVVRSTSELSPTAKRAWRRRT
jgi:hypothetical protein